MTRVLFGVAFLTIAATALFSSGDIDQSTAWLWAVGLGGVGLAGLIASISTIVRLVRS